MRIVLLGQAAFGEQVLQMLTKRGEEFVGVYTPPDIPGRANPLKELAAQLAIPVFQPKGMQTPEIYAEYTKLEPDLNVMAYVTDIIPESILNYPKLGTISYHPSLLPKHRGGSAINWAIISSETKTGITILWPDKGIDTGPILLQKEVEISPDDTVGSLYYNKLFPLGIEAIVESIELIKKGIAPRIHQDESLATYERLCTEKDAIINWSQLAAEVYNLIRGTNPQPGAMAYFRGQRFKIYDVELVTGNTSCLPGYIVGISQQGFIVAAINGAILVKRVQVAGSSKVDSSAFAEQAHLKTGDRLDG